MLAFCITNLLNNFTLTIQHKKCSVEFVLSQCTELQLSLNQLNRTLSPVLLIQNLSVGLQQAVEIYVGTKMIQYTAPSAILLSLIFDLMVMKYFNYMQNVS